MIWIHGAVGIAMDVALLLLPVWVINKYLRFSSKTLQVILVFCVSIFAIATDIVRFGMFLHSDISIDT